MAFDLEAITSLPASILALLAKQETPELLRPAPAPPPMATVPMGPASGQISTDATGPAMPSVPQPSFLQPSGMTNAYEPGPPIDRPAPPPAPRRPLQQSLTASGVATPAPAVPDAPPGAGAATGATSGDPYEAQRAEYRKKREALEAEYTAANAPPDYAAMQEQMQQRRQAYLPGAMAAVLAGMGPQAGKVLQAGMMARADEARQPLKIEGGQITAEGEVMIDPAFQRQKKIDSLTRRIDAIDKLDAQTLDAQQKAILAREKYQADIELRREIAAGRREMAAAVRAASGGRDWVTMKGPDNVEYLVNRVTNERRNPWADMGTAGRPDALPASAPAELKTRYSNASEAVNTMPAVAALVQKHPEAFGARVGYAEMAGGLARVGQHQVPILGKDLTKEQQSVRAEVFLKYGKLMHDLIGSAQTVTEQERLRSFVPAPGEDAAGVIRKMAGGIAEAKRIRAELARQYGMQPGGGAAPPGPAGPGAPAPGTPSRGDPDSYYKRP